MVDWNIYFLANIAKVQNFSSYSRTHNILSGRIVLLKVPGFRVDMSKGLQLAYNLHAKTLTNHLLAYSLTKPLKQIKSMYFHKFFNDKSGKTGIG